MFDFIRTHQRLMQFLLLLLIVPSFALLGVESYTRMGDSANVIAKVGDQKILKEELDAAQRQQADRLRQAYGPRFDPKMLDNPEARQGLLDNLIAQKALSVEAARNRLSVSDASLQQSILQIPDLQGADGKFDVERYKALLAAQGMSPTMFEAQLRQDLALQQINAAVQNSAFAPKALSTRLSEINEQQREVQEMLFKASDYASKVKVTDELLKTYYDNSGSRFETPEQVSAEYVVLNPAAAAAQVTVDAGATLAAVQEHARAAGLDFGVDLAARESATVGGLTATNAGGIRVLRYGSMRAQVMGAEAVLADGSVVSRLGGLAKDNTGYDLVSLLCGSEGTLGVITRLRLRLVPRLRARTVALLALPDTATAVALLPDLRERLPDLAAAELFLAPGLALVRSYAGLPAPFPVEHPAYLVLECAGRTDPTDALVEAVSEVDGKGAYVVTRDGHSVTEERIEPRRLR